MFQILLGAQMTQTVVSHNRSAKRPSINSWSHSLLIVAIITAHFGMFHASVVAQRSVGRSTSQESIEIAEVSNPAVDVEKASVDELSHEFVMLLGLGKKTNLLAISKELVKRQMINGEVDQAMMNAMFLIRSFQGSPGLDNSDIAQAYAIAAVAAHKARNNELARKWLSNANKYDLSGNLSEDATQFIHKTDAMLNDLIAADEQANKPQRKVLPVLFGPWPHRPVEKGRAIVMIDDAFTLVSRGGFGNENNPASYSYQIHAPDGAVTEGSGRCVLVDDLKTGDYRIVVRVERDGDVQTAETSLGVEPRPRSPQTARSAFTNSMGMKFREIPKGSFVMGSNQLHGSSATDCLPRVVDIERSFYMAECEVDQMTYRQVLGVHSVSDPRDARKPVCGITYEQASEFCEMLSLLPGEVAAGRRYRLPTEQEWEYACRGGTETRFYFGDTIEKSDAIYGYSGGATGSPFRYAATVDSHQSNGFGLFHMHGNVDEWCLDRFVPIRGWVMQGETTSISPLEVQTLTRNRLCSQEFRDDWLAVGLPGRGPFSLKESLEKRFVLRGGEVDSKWENVRSASRHGTNHNSAYGQHYGIRLVCEKVDSTTTTTKQDDATEIWNKPWGSFEFDQTSQSLRMNRRTEANPGRARILSEKKYRDFEIEFEIRLRDEGHFGAVSFVFRATPQGYDPPMIRGMPTVVFGEYKKSRWFDGRKGEWGQLNFVKYQNTDRKISEFHHRLEQLMDPHQFNKIKVRCVGDHLTVSINGETINYYGLNIPQHGNIAFEGSVHPFSGINTEIRNIKVVDLSRQPAQSSADKQQPANSASESFSGKWVNDRGVVFDIVQRGNSINGSYVNPRHSSVIGRLSGNVVENAFTATYRTPYGTGEVVWTRTNPNSVQVKWVDQSGSRGTYIARRRDK